MSRFGGDPWAAFPDADAAVATATPSKDPWASFPDAGGEVHDDGVTNARDRGAIDDAKQRMRVDAITNRVKQERLDAATAYNVPRELANPDPEATAGLTAEPPSTIGPVPPGPTGLAGFARNVTRQSAEVVRATGIGNTGRVGEAMRTYLDENLAGEGVGGKIGDFAGGMLPLAAGPFAPVIAANKAMGPYLDSGDPAGALLHGSIEAVLMGPGGSAVKPIGDAIASRVGTTAADGILRRAAAQTAGGLGEGAVFGGGSLLAHTSVDVATGKKTLQQAADDLLANAPEAVLGGAVAGAAIRPVMHAGAIVRGDPNSTLSPESTIRPVETEPALKTEPDAPAKGSPEVPLAEISNERPIAEEAAPAQVEERTAQPSELPKLSVAEAADRPAQERDVQGGVLEPAPVQEVGDGAEQLEGPTRRAADGPADVQDRVTPAPAEEAAPVVKAEEPAAAAPPASRLDRLIDATNRWEQAIVDRSKNRAIPRGRNVGATILIPELSDLAVRAALRSVRVAAKGAKVGARTIHAVRDEVVSMAKELGVNMGEHTAAVVRAAHRIVVRVGDDPERIDAEIASHYARHKDEAPKRSVKQTIRESVEGPKAAKTITEPQALKAKLKAEEKGANVGFRAGKAEAMETMQARIDKLRSDIKSKANTIEQVREKVIGAIKDLVPNERQHAFITAASDAKSVGDYWRVLARAQREAFDHSARVAGREAVKAVDDAVSTKMLTSDNAKAKDLETRLKVAKAGLREQASPSVKLRVTQQLNDIHNEARELVARHKNAQTIMVGERIVKTENLVKSFTDDVAKGAKIKRASQGVETAPEPGLLGKADRYLMSQDTLGKVVGNEDVHRLMTDDLWDGQREVARDSQGGQDAIEKWLGEAGVKPGSEEAQKLSADVVGAKKARKTTVKLVGGETIDMTPAEHMSLVATLTDSNAGPQIAGGLADVTFSRDPLGRRTKLGEGDAERIIKALPENLRGVVDKAKAYVEKESRPKLFEAFRKEKGYDLDAVEGYWRTRRNWELSDASPEVVKKYRDAALTNLGFEKPREGGKLPYLIGDFFTDFHDIIHQSSAVANMASRVSQLQMIFTDPRVKAAIGERFGHGMNRNIQKFVEEGKLLFRQPQDAGGKVTDFITKGLSRAVLPLNPSPMLKNIAGVFKLGNEISPDRIAKAAKIAYSDEVTKIIQEDPYFRDRYEGGSGKRLTPVFSERPATVGESSVLDLVKRGAVGQIVDRIPIFDFFDQIPVRLAIADRVLAARESGASGDTAGRESSHLVERTQNSSNPLNMSPLQLEARGTFWRTAATMFKSDAYKSYGMLRAASGQGRGPFLRALAAVGLSNAWAAAVTALFAREAWKKIAGKEEDQKKDRDLSTTFATAFTRNAAEMLPLGGDAFDMISAGTVNRPKQGLPNFAKILQGPLSQTASTMGEALAQAYQAIGSGDELFKSGPHKGEEKRGVYAKQSVENALRAAGRVLGVPLEPLWNLAKKADSVAGDE